MSKDTFKRYALSSLVTFLSAFVIVLAPALDESFTVESLWDGTLAGLLFAAARLGVKMVLEQLIPILPKR